MRYLLQKCFEYRLIPRLRKFSNKSKFTGISNENIPNKVKTQFEGTLPIIYLPLPSKNELCRFTLLPYGYSVGDFINSIKNEDGGIDRVAIYNDAGVRLAKSTPLETLLKSSFNILIDDKKHSVDSLLESTETSVAGITAEDRFKTSLLDLFATFNMAEHKEVLEKKYIDQIERLTVQLEPYEKSKKELIIAADRRAQLFGWLGLAFMGIQTGILGRLTWFEYSWDIMEPITYFVTYLTGMFFYAYFMVTRQEYTYQDAHNRHFLKALHKMFAKRNLSVEVYNDLTEKLADANKNLNSVRNNFLQLQMYKSDHKF